MERMGLTRTWNVESITVSRTIVANSSAVSDFYMVSGD